jgi:uncharacterized protein YggE
MNLNSPENPESQNWRHTLVRASRPVRIAVTVVLLILALFLLVMTIDGLHNWGQPDANGPSTITVTGEGTATAIPDTASISFGDTVTNTDVATAEAQMTSTINSALSSIEALGIPKSDITTTSYNVSPHYSETVCPPGIFCPASTVAAGYDVSEMIQVNVTDTTKVSGVLGALAKANITNVSGPDYIVGDTQSVMQQARAQAITKAQSDAKTLASQLGVHLGKVTDFEDNTGGVTAPEPEFKAAGAMDSTAVVNPSVPVGNSTYTDDVSITYEIN